MNAAFAIPRSGVTSSVKRAETLYACCKLLGRSDERWLVGVDGKRRGHRITAPSDRSTARQAWQLWAGEWTLRQLAAWREITLDHWKPARTTRRFSRGRGAAYDAS
jgi:hypothetical protein